MKFGLILIALISLLACKSNDKAMQADICILSGSEAGFTAAIQAALMGKKVVLIEPTGHPGGMMVEGIVKDIRFGSGAVISGITRDLYYALEKHYDRVPQFDDVNWYSPYEPKVAEQIIEEMLAEYPNIHIIRNQRILETDGVEKQGTVIKNITLENGQSIAADIFIDASIEGDLLHFASVSTCSIRGGNDLYGEIKNGVQVDNHYRQFRVKVDPYKTPGDPESGLIATIQSGSLGEYGAPSKYIQGFCFRLCLTNNKDNLIPIDKPANYAPANYEIYRRYLNNGGKLFKPFVKRANDKTDLGSWHDLSANLYGENWMYPEGSYAVRDSVVKYHRDFTQGLIWFLQNDTSVNEQTRHNWQGWGLSKDEFTDNEGWPRRLYIRSARRMVSDYVITEHHTRRDNTERVEDPVAIAWWPPDTHHARRIVKDGYAYNEGFVFGGDDWRPFGISWRALVPKSSECTNLISPTCPSSSYVAYGAIRILTTFMMLGQSAGTAAAMAQEQNIAVQKLDYKEIKQNLLNNQQTISLPNNWLEIIKSGY